MLNEFVGSPGVALLVLGVLVLEGVVLFLIWGRMKKGLQFQQTISFLGAGACFALCLYGALSSFGGIWIGITLAAAFVFHLWDLKLRWQS